MLPSEINHECLSNSVDDYPTPWTRPLNLNLLSSPLIDAFLCKTSTSERYRGHRQFVALPHARHVQRLSPQSIDFDISYRHSKSDLERDAVAKELERSSELQELIRGKVKKSEKFAKKDRGNHPRTRYRRTSSSISRRGTTKTLDCSKSVFRSLSCGVRSFILRPSRSRVDNDEIPVRLNRLHGANEFSMSSLAPAVRREFMRMSQVHTRPKRASRETNARREEFVDRQKIDLTYIPTHCRRRPGSPKHHISINDESFLLTKDMVSTESWPFLREIGEHVGQCSKNGSDGQKDERDDGETRTTNVENDDTEQFCKSVEIKSPKRTSLFDPSILDSNSDRDASWAAVQESENREFPFNVPNLIQYYDGVESVRAESPSGGSSPFKIGSLLDVKSNPTRFEQNADIGNNICIDKKCTEQRAAAPINQISPSPYGTDRSRANGEIIAVNRDEMQAGVGRKISQSQGGNDFCEKVAISKGAKVGGSQACLMESDMVNKKLDGERSFLSSVTPSASPSTTPSSDLKFSLSQTFYVAATLGEEDAVTSKKVETSEVKWLRDEAQWDVDVSGDAHGTRQIGKPMNLIDLFDSMELSPGRKRASFEARRAKVRFRPINEEPERDVKKVDEERGREFKDGRNSMRTG